MGQRGRNEDKWGRKAERTEKGENEEGRTPPSREKAGKTNCTAAGVEQTYTKTLIQGEKRAFCFSLGKSLFIFAH